MAAVLETVEGSKVALGQLTMSRGINERVAFDVRFAAGLLNALGRHGAGDWGEVGREDWRANDWALRDGSRLLSSYTVGGEKVWIITEADRSLTTALLPSEY